MKIPLTASIGLIVVLMISTFGMLSGCAPAEEVQPPPPAVQDPPPPAVQDDAVTQPEETLSPQALVESRCTRCHDLDRVQAAEYDRAGWEQTVDRMMGKGLVLTEEEYSAIVDYFSTR